MKKSFIYENSFTSPKYNKEEEVLAYEYTGSNFGTVDGVQISHSNWGLPPGA